MRKLYGLLAALVISIGAAAPASAADITGSSLGLVIGALPGVVAPQSPDPIAISVTGGGGFTIPAGAFAAAVIIPKQLFTGVNLISSLNMNFSNASGAMGAGGGTAGTIPGGFGGTMSLIGQSVVGVLGGVLNLVIPLNVVGAGAGGTAKAVAFDLAVTVTGAGWTTHAAKVTGITTTTTTTLSGGTQVTHIFNTVTQTGADNRVGGVGTVVLVSPTRVLTNAAGNLPAFATLILNFVPEPGTLLLLGSGVVGLAIVGRKRLRK